LVQRLRALFRTLGRKSTPESSLRESLDEAIDEVIEEVIEERKSSVEDLRAEERLMFQNIIKFGALRVEDVMVPRADIVGVEVNTAVDDLIGIFHDASHSRLPVYRDTLDDPIGMVHIKDRIGCIAGRERGEEEPPAADGTQPANGTGDKASLAKLKREVLYVPPSMPIIDLLIRMQTTRIHMALVVDEYGGTDGLVTIEDLVEQIVGEIEDEHDTEASPTLVPRARGGIDADARVPIEDLEELIDRNLSLDDKEEDIDTLGGLVFSLAGRVPQRGELIAHPQAVDFEVVDADPRRIKKLRIRVKDHAANDADGTARAAENNNNKRPSKAGREAPSPEAAAPSAAAPNPAPPNGAALNGGRRRLSSAGARAGGAENLH